ncbi:hypothetical protein [Burkholderia perseverans]|uniref:hypothetical protein n=1 Tax=Burkholderia perseverans TaxID=2615214 RepID=UPI001FEFB6AC|nr:hypothetical protein [Burkholderia perseverans]
MDALIDWKIRHRKARRAAGWAFRIARNALAIVGIFFVYLLIHGYGQCSEARDAQVATCAASRCA